MIFNDRLSCSETIIKKNIEVIPLNKHKTPTVSFADKDVTDEFIEYHSYKYHQTNMLGVLTRNVWCIDIDINHADGENGFESIKDIPYYEEIVSNAQDTLVQTTASGGKHIIFINVMVLIMVRKSDIYLE